MSDGDGWDLSEDKLVSDIACLFFDAQTVKSVPSDYARTAIAGDSRAMDEARRMKKAQWSSGQQWMSL